MGYSMFSVFHASYSDILTVFRLVCIQTWSLSFEQLAYVYIPFAMYARVCACAAKLWLEVTELFACHISM